MQHASEEELFFDPLPTVADAAAEAAADGTPTVAPSAAAGSHPQITMADTTTLSVRDPRRPKGKGKGPKDADQIAAAAAAADGIRQRRAEAGLGCKVCGLVFASRNLLLKHIDKTGHITDPTRRTGIITGLYYIPPTILAPLEAGEKKPKKKWRNFAQKEPDSDSD